MKVWDSVSLLTRKNRRGSFSSLAPEIRAPRGSFVILISLFGLSLLCGALSGCDVIVEAAYASPYEEAIYQDGAEGISLISLADGQSDSDPALLDDEGVTKLTEDESISYHQLVTIGILYAVNNRPASSQPLLEPGEWMDLPVIPEVSIHLFQNTFHFY